MKINAKLSHRIAMFFMASLLAFPFYSCSSDDEEERKEPTKKTASESFSKAISTLKAVEGINGVFTVEYTGEYNIDDAVKSNLKTSSELLSYLTKKIPTWKTQKDFVSPLKINVQGAACSSIVAENATEGTSGYIYGRNFDWDPGNSLIVHTKPDSGYEAVSTCYLLFLTEKADWTPQNNVEKDAIALGGIYVPMDGMNEKGLYIANLNDSTYAVIPSNPDSTKKDVQTTVAIRYILDKCATVDEAVTFLKTVNMYSVYAVEESASKKPHAYHFAIADNSGKSVVAEWVDEKLVVTESKIVTNHNLAKENNSPTTGDDRNHGTFRRFDFLKAAGEAKKWKMTSEEVKDALKAVQQEGSVWSAVFEPSVKRVTYYFRNPDAAEDSEEPIDYTKPVVVQF